MANSYPLSACLNRAAILHFFLSFFLLHLSAMSSVVLISDLLYQSAAIVFLDGGWVSERFVMVSLAFHLFVVGTVIFASVRLWHFFVT